MADAMEIPQAVEGVTPVESGAAVDMELEAVAPQNATAAAAAGAANGVHKPEENGTGKREREEGGDGDDRADVDEETAKRLKVEKSVEEERLEKLEKKGVEEGDGEGEETEGATFAGEGEEKERLEKLEQKGVEEGEGEEEVVGEGEETKGTAVGEGDEKEKEVSVGLGPKVFSSAVEMFDYFFKFLHHWSPNVDINKYEHMVFLDLIQKGHAEPETKIGEGIQAFQVRYHPLWKSRCFFLVRVDGSTDDFSFRKCVDHILPLPDNMKPLENKKAGGNQKGSGHGGRGGRGGGRGGRRGRGRRGGGGFGK